MKRKPLDNPEVAAWLAKSEGDLRMSRAAIEVEDPLWDQCCFHSQQAAEKSLKALLLFLDSDVPKTHDLVFVLEKILFFHPDASCLLEDAAALVQYGVAPRYPSFLAPETEEDALEAMDRAKRICNWVTKHLTASEEP
jgi:HEPN domain-containing protein